MDRKVWWATVCRVTQNQTQLKYSRTKHKQGEAEEGDCDHARSPEDGWSFFFSGRLGLSTPYLQIHNLCKVSFTLGLKSF